MTRNIIITDIRKFIDTFIYFIESPLCSQQSYPIYLGHSIPPEGSILYNTEQLSRSSMLSIVLNNIRSSNPVEIWDYSLANINILKGYDIISRHVPLDIPGWYIEELNNYRRNGITYDVGHSGTLTGRRLEIINLLKSSNISINIIELFGKDRDIELAKCKIILNIHAEDDYKIFESCRCEPWLKLGVTVISENSLDNDPRCINVNYNDIVKTVVEFISDDNLNK